MSQKLKKSYQLLINWNKYRLKQNNESLKKLNVLLAALDRDGHADPSYQKDIVDLDSLKIIYETSFRNFDGQIKKYSDLIAEMSKNGN